MSIMRPVMFSSALMSRSSTIGSSGKSGVRFSNRIFVLAFSGASLATVSDVDAAATESVTLSVGTGTLNVDRSGILAGRTTIVSGSVNSTTSVLFYGSSRTRSRRKDGQVEPLKVLDRVVQGLRRVQDCTHKPNGVRAGYPQVIHDGGFAQVHTHQQDP